MIPFTLDENILSTTLWGKSSSEIDREFKQWKDNTLQKFSNKTIQILNISFTKVYADYSMNNYYSMNIIYRIGG